MVKNGLRIHFLNDSATLWATVVHNAAQSVLLLTSCVNANWLQRVWWIGESCLYSGLLDTRVGYYTISMTSVKKYGWKTDHIFPDLTLFFTRFSITPRLTRKQLLCYSKTGLHISFCDYFVKITKKFPLNFLRSCN